ncbi:MAG: hypothetical protein LUF85_13290 [Bacteroides sp.]|nr:hypothetical protein [Bacteroides sp.]
MKAIVVLEEIRQFLSKEEKFRKLKFDYLAPDTLKVSYIWSAEVKILVVEPRSILLGYKISGFKKWMLGAFSGFIQSKVDSRMLSWDRENSQVHLWLDHIEQLQPFFMYAEIKDLHIVAEDVVLELNVL